jgi:hypothetical protein
MVVPDPLDREQMSVICSFAHRGIHKEPLRKLLLGSTSLALVAASILFGGTNAVLSRKFRRVVVSVVEARWPKDISRCLDGLHLVRG